MAVTALPAFAQTLPPAPVAPAADTPAVPDENWGNDIIVIATRRGETVRDVLIAVTAVGRQLFENARVTDIRGLEQLAPSLQTTTGQSSATGSSLSIRCVGTAGDNDDDFTSDTNAVALFTHNILNLTDTLPLMLGTRYNPERKEQDATVNGNPAACAFFPGNDPRAVACRGVIGGASPALFQNLFPLGCNPAISSEFNGTCRHDRSESRLTGTAKPAYRFGPDVPGYASDPLPNGGIGVQADDGRMSAAFFVENIIEQYYDIPGFAIPEQTGTYGVYPAIPRFHGVRAQVGF